MAKKLKVNFSQLAERGKEQKELAEKFEKARQDFQTIVNSLNECWEGTDATAFINNCNNYLEYLKKDTLYFDILGEYFNKSSSSYGTVVAENREKVNRLNSLIAENVQDRDITKGGL